MAYFLIFEKNRVESYRGLQGAKIDHVNLGERVQTALDSFLDPITQYPKLLQP